VRRSKAAATATRKVRVVARGAGRRQGSRGQPGAQPGQSGSAWGLLTTAVMLKGCRKETFMKPWGPEHQAMLRSGIVLQRSSRACCVLFAAHGRGSTRNPGANCALRPLKAPLGWHGTADRACCCQGKLLGIQICFPHLSVLSSPRTACSAMSGTVQAAEAAAAALL
jgi:hypothetical protein